MRSFSFIPRAFALLAASTVVLASSGAQTVDSLPTPPRDPSTPSVNGAGPAGGMTITGAPTGTRDPASPGVNTSFGPGGEIAFAAAVSYTVAAPKDVATGDFDRDGDLDIAVTSRSPERVVVFGNQGNGVFSATQAVFLTAGSQPHSPIAADLDYDGDIDLAVTLSGLDSVQLVINNGIGLFSTPNTVPVGDDPRAIAYGDIDDDNDIDLVVVNRGSDTLSILRNQGFLAFQVTTEIVGPGLREVALGDFDKDKLLDIAVASFDAQQVSVLMNLGSASFGPPFNLKASSTAVRPEGVDTADIDGDGKLDVVASSSAGGEDILVAFFGQGNGTFSLPMDVDLHGSGASDLDAADFNLDNDVDVATAHAVSAEVLVLVNSGAGDFGAQKSFGVNQPTKLTVGDVNRDTLPDIITVNESTNSISVLLNQSPGLGCAVTQYCQGELNSAGTTAQITFDGTPSATTQGFEIAMIQALPNKFGGAFYGTTGPQDVPFMGGRLCVAGPLKRMQTQLTDANGTMSYSMPVLAGMADTTRWFQFWYRDPTAQDGFTLATSDAMEVTFCH